MCSDMCAKFLTDWFRHSDLILADRQTGTHTGSTADSMTNSADLRPSREAANVAATQDCPYFTRTPMVIAVFTRARHWSAFWPRSTRSLQPHLSKIYLNIIYISTSWSSLHSLSFHHSHQYHTCVHALVHSCYIPCTAHPLDLILLIILGEVYKLRMEITVAHFKLFSK
jgi:hypothetical protein